MALFLSISGMVVLVLAALGSQWRLRWKIATVLMVSALSVGLIAIFLGHQLVIIRGESEPIWAQSPWKELLLFLAMLLGMTAKCLWDLIEVRRCKNASRREGEPKIGIEFDFWDFVQPLLVAAMVFAGVIAAVKGFSATSFLFSFQNGFFWQAVLKQKSFATIGSTGAG
jgi:hypothetical protein